MTFDVEEMLRRIEAMLYIQLFSMFYLRCSYLICTSRQEIYPTVLIGLISIKRLIKVMFIELIIDKISDI